MSAISLQQNHHSKFLNKLYKKPNSSTLILLAPALIWFLVFYVIPLFSLLTQSIYTFDEMSMTVSHDLTLDNFKTLLTDASNFDIFLRTFVMSVSVSIGCALIGYPIAYYMARYAKGATKGLLYVLIMLPMWASYIVKAYAWTVILSKEGLVYWLVNTLSLDSLLAIILDSDLLGGSTLSTSHFGRFLVFTYMWLPFMILPIQASIERVQSNVILASSDLGASPFYTFRRVILPLTIPGVAAGSIFTFCLTFGDYIIPSLVGPAGDFLGTAVYRYQGAIGNLPLAAALALIPVVVIATWLWLAKKLGAFDAL